MKHASLEIPTKPLVDPKEIREKAHDYLMEAIDREMKKLVQETTALENLQQTADEIKKLLTDLSESNREPNKLKMEVLSKLKAKLSQ